MGVNGYSKDDPFKVVYCPDKLNEPLRVKKPAVIGVSFMGDLFHEEVDYVSINRIFKVIRRCPQHTFIILTKRIKNAKRYFSHPRGYRHFTYAKVPSNMIISTSNLITALTL